MQENPCSIFYSWKNTLHLKPDPDFCARIRILDWDRQNIEKIFENPQNAGEPLPIFLMTEKTLVKTFRPRVAVIRSTSIYSGTTDREPFNVGT